MNTSTDITKLCAALAIAATLTACAPNPCKPDVQVQYVRTEVPAALLVIPPYPAPLRQGATEREKADWILSTEERMQTLENNLLGIAEFLKKQAGK